MITDSIALDIFGLIAAFIVIIITYLKWHYSHWTRLGLEQLKPTLVFGNAWENISQKKTLGQVLSQVYFQMKAKGVRHAGFYYFHLPIYIPIDLQLVKRIMQNDFAHFVDRGIYINEKDDPLSAHLFSLEGVKWRNLRTKLTPTFTSGKMKMMLPIVVKTSEEVTKVLDACPPGKPVEIKDIVARLTTDIIGTCAFGLECNSLKDPDNEFRRQGVKFLDLSPKELLTTFCCFLFPDVMKKLHTKMIPASLSDFFLGVVKNIVAYREKNNVKRDDFMHLLLQLKNYGRLSDDVSKSVSPETMLTFEELAAQAFVFFLAGFETSSTTMGFCLLELSLNQDVQEKLRREINEVLGKHDGTLTYEAIQEMAYLDMVISEALRKYPPIPHLQRVCTMDYKVPDTDIVLKKGTVIFISAEGIQHDPEYYPNPEVFDPTRFGEENKHQRNAFTFLPFGEGPRICIGLRFGLMQAKVGLAVLLRNYRFKLNPLTEVPVKMEPKKWINTVKGGIWMDVEKLSL